MEALLIILGKTGAGVDGGGGVGVVFLDL